MLRTQLHTWQRNGVPKCYAKINPMRHEGSRWKDRQCNPTEEKVFEDKCLLDKYSNTSRMSSIRTEYPVENSLQHPTERYFFLWFVYPQAASRWMDSMPSKTAALRGMGKTPSRAQIHCRVPHQAVLLTDLIWVDTVDSTYLHK